MNRAYWETEYNSYDRNTTWSSVNNNRPVYTAKFNRAEVMGDTLKQIQFQIVGYNYDTSESNTVLRSYDYNTGSDLSVADLNNKIFIVGLGPLDYSIESMTFYSVIPSNAGIYSNPRIKINVHVTNAFSEDEGEAWTYSDYDIAYLESTGDLYKKGEELLDSYGVTIDPYRVFGVQLKYDVFQLQWMEGYTWKGQYYSEKAGSAAGFDGKVFYSNEDSGNKRPLFLPPVDYVATERTVPNPMTIYFAVPNNDDNWNISAESGKIMFNVGYEDGTDGGHWKNTEMEPTRRSESSPR